MDPHQAERLVAGLVSAGLILLSQKLGLPANVQNLLAGLSALVLGGSVVHTAIDKFAASKGGQDLGAALEAIAKLKAAFAQAKAQQAQADGAAAGAAPGSPSQA